MALITFKYKLDEEGIAIMAGCATRFSEEIKEAVTHAFEEILVTIEHDEDFGTFRIVAVNHHNLCGCP